MSASAPRSSNASRWLREQYGVCDSIQGIRDLVRACQVERGVAGPPYDPLDLAESRLVHSLRLQQLHCPAYLETDREGFVIFLDRVVGSQVDAEYRLGDGRRPESLTPRQRFSLAHEIAHTFFYDYRRVPPERPEVLGRHGDVAEERLCDVGAQEILAPRAALAAFMEGRQGNYAEASVAIASRFVLSVQAASFGLLAVQDKVVCAVYFTQSAKPGQPHTNKLRVGWKATRPGSWVPTGASARRVPGIVETARDHAGGRYEGEVELGSVRGQCSVHTKFFESRDREPEVLAVIVSNTHCVLDTASAPS